MKIKRTCWVTVLLTGLYLHSPHWVLVRIDNSGRLKWQRE